MEIKHLCPLCPLASLLLPRTSRPGGQSPAVGLRRAGDISSSATPGTSWDAGLDQDACLCQVRVVVLHLLKPGPPGDPPNSPTPQSHPRATHPPGENPPQALLHLWMLILQDCAAGGCAFLCCLSSLPAATKWSQALVFSNTRALPHAVCCSSTKEVLECLL